MTHATCNDLLRNTYESFFSDIVTALLQLETTLDIFFFLNKTSFTLFAMMSLRFVLQQENGTPQASLDPNMLDVQLK